MFSEVEWWVPWLFLAVFLGGLYYLGMAVAVCIRWHRRQVMGKLVEDFVKSRVMPKFPP